MKLREWDFDEGDSGSWVEVEYPDKIIQDFMNFTLNNRQWPEQLEIMYNRFLRLKRELTEAHNEMRAPKNWDAVADGYCHAETRSGNPCQNTDHLKDGLCPIHRKMVAVA